MNQEQKASLLVRILSLVLFLILTLGAFAWFSISIAGLFSQISTDSQVVEFDKGAMYMFGCGLGLLLLTIGGLMQGILGMQLTSKKESLFTRGIIFCLLLMFALPQLAHYLVDNYLGKRQYSICEAATFRWLLYSKIYYTESKSSCDDIIIEKEMAK